MSERKVVHAQLVKLTASDKRLLRNRNDRSLTEKECGEYFFFRDDVHGDIIFDVCAFRVAIITDKVFYTVVDMPVDQDFRDFAASSGQAELEYADSLPLSALKIPVLAVTWDDGSSTIIDGNNRIVKAFNVKRPSIKMVQVRWPFWKFFSKWKRDGDWTPELSEKFKSIVGLQ